jgi:hypothetical protein
VEVEEEDEDEDVPVGPPTTEEEPIHYLIMSLGESPYL